MLYILKNGEDILGGYNNLSTLVDDVQKDIEINNSCAEDYTIKVFDGINFMQSPEEIGEFTIVRGIQVINADGDVVGLYISDGYDEDDDFDYED